MRTNDVRVALAGTVAWAVALVVLLVAAPVLARPRVAVAPLDGDDDQKVSEIVADAAYAMLTRDSRQYTGNLALVEDVLAEEGITDLSAYSYGGSDAELQADLFVD